MIKNIGKHKVKLSDVTNGIDDLMGNEKADIIYSDPPWGEGNLKYWQTINKRHTGKEPVPQNLQHFLDSIFKVYKDFGKDLLFVEYGIQWREMIISGGLNAGYHHIDIINLKYKSGSKLLPLDLHVFSRNKISLTADYIKSVENTHGYKTLQMAISPFAKEGNIILDPCCGMGYTAQIAIDNNMIFRGNELNARRLDKTIKRLEKAVNVS